MVTFFQSETFNPRIIYEHMSFYNQLIYLIAFTLQLPTRRIVQSTDLRGDLNLDEYDFQMLIFRLEHFYKIEFGQEEIHHIKIVKDLGEIIANKESSAIWFEPNLYAASF